MKLHCIKCKGPVIHFAATSEYGEHYKCNDPACGQQVPYGYLQGYLHGKSDGMFEMKEKYSGRL